MKKDIQWVNSVRLMKDKKYWNLPNTVEFFAFFMKVVILVPGLLFNIQLWWLYIFSLVTSVSLIWSSTKKTLPTIILLNVAWVFISIISIVKNFWWFV